MYIILVYDIVMDESGARVQRNVFKICKKYLTHIQNSVFEGEVSDAKLLKMQLEIKKYIIFLLDSFGFILFNGFLVNNLIQHK